MPVTPQTTPAEPDHAYADLFDKVGADPRVRLMEFGRRHGVLPYFRVVESHAAPVVRIEGADRLMLGSNNYLGLTEHPAVRAAAHEAIDRYGTALTGSRLQNGTIPLHRELEEEVADWLGTEDALVYASGYLANVGCISALVTSRDTVIVDSLDHASILDGCKLAGGRLRPYRHNNLQKLADLVDRAGSDGGGTLVVVNSVLSMEGGAVGLASVVAACRRRPGVRLLVDEAHAIGVLGSRGAGLAELMGVEDEVDIRMGTFSKALASCGGFIAADKAVVEYLRVNSRPFLFTVAAVPSALASALAAVRICRSPAGEELFARLLENAAYLRNGLLSLGFRTVEQLTLPDGTEYVTPIVPIRVGDENQTILLWKRLWDAGLYANVAVYPAVPPRGGVIRMSVMASHTREHLDRALDILAAIGPGELTTDVEAPEWQ
jgi:8-amino-7-oxononanoate synthase